MSSKRRIVRHFMNAKTTGHVANLTNTELQKKQIDELQKLNKKVKTIKNIHIVFNVILPTALIISLPIIRNM
jgi:hypothetical protein